MRLGAFGTNRTVYNAKVSLFLRYSKWEDRWSVQKLRLLYIMKTWLSNKGSITPNAYCLISAQIILGQVRHSHFTQGCSRYLHSSWRYKKTEWNNTLKPQFFCDKSKYWSFLDRVTADTRSVHGAMKCICKLVWRGLKTNYFSLTSPTFCTVDLRGYFSQVTTYREKVGSTRKVRHRCPCLKWFSVMLFVL